MNRKKWRNVEVMKVEEKRKWREIYRDEKDVEKSGELLDEGEVNHD